ncbi:MAG TPA: sensor histidine kinase [Flavisolibacter sp.]|nr:sensor histidine kinase [Flavisolibacter sp.]
MSKLALLLLFAASISAAHAQENDYIREKDSMLQKLSSAKEDTAKAMLLLTLASWYETSNQDSAAYFLEKGKALSERLNFLRGLYHYQNQKTILLYTKGEYKPAMKEAEKGLAIARQMKDTVNVIAMLNNLGILSMYFGDYEGQLAYAMQVVKSVEAIKDSANIAGAYLNLANSYHALKQYRKGVNNAAYGIYVNTVNTQKYGYINRCYAALAQCYEGLRMMDSALYYYDIAIKESERANDKYAEASIYGYKSNVHALLSQFGLMLVSSKKSYDISAALQSRQLTAGALNTLAFAQFLNNSNAEAKKSILPALAIAREDSLIEELKEAYTILSYIAARDGDFSASIGARKAADSIGEVILNDKVIRNTSELEQKYESAKKDARIQLQQAQLFRKDTWNYILVGSIATILTISLLSYRNYRHRRKLQHQRINELEREKLLAATEAVLKGEEQERTRLAKDLHDGLGGMLSGIKYSLHTMKGNQVMTAENAQAFERSIDMLDSSIAEMRRVAHNMMPEALVKFGLDTALRDFCNDINQTGALTVTYQSIGMKDISLEQTKSVTVYRIVQELLNNIIKHAAAKSALVQLNYDSGQLAVTVEDDGKGFDPVILKQSRGIGWSSIQNRTEFLQGKWDVSSGAGKGTSVHVAIPA